MKKQFLPLIFCTALITLSCNNEKKKFFDNENSSADFKYLTEQFADTKIIRYKIPGFDQLSLQQKKLCYYLYQAGLSGRDIIWDQNFKYNLTIRRTIEAIVNSCKGDKESDDFKKFLVYAKRVWFSNGIHHHYGSVKFTPEFSKEYFIQLINNSDEKLLPLDGLNKDVFIQNISSIIFDADKFSKRVNLDPTQDMIQTSAMNYYEGVTQKEVEAFYKKMANPNDSTPIWYGLNSKVVKENGEVKEKVYKIGGMYSAAIEKIVYWLDKAITVAENDQQKKSLQLLSEYYKTGDLRKFDEYNIEWVKDTASVVDVVNGFIEVYGDPLGIKASYESVVSIKDFEASKRISTLSKYAQWFEDNSPLKPNHKKKDVKGISAKVINVIVESGDASPSTPIGINLPNSDWVRKDHGSKSVNLGNIVHGYGQAALEGGSTLSEFAFNEQEIELSKKHAALSDNLHTDMHEVLGHASGQLNPGVGTPKQTLKSYASCLEEGRADLFALYFIMDPKLVELGLMTSTDVGKAEYNSYIRNGMMTQLTRLKLGDEIEESHMRNRQLVAKWAFEKGQADNVIEKVTKDNKTYFVVRDYNKLRDLFGQLLQEIQRIKSEGDYEAGKKLVETYGVKVDQDLHKEVLDRYSKLNIAPYGGFINPRLVPVMNGDEITDVKVEYPDNFMKQMLEYAKEYSFLPNIN